MDDLLSFRSLVELVGSVLSVVTFVIAYATTTNVLVALGILGMALVVFVVGALLASLYIDRAHAKYFSGSNIILILFVPVMAGLLLIPRHDLRSFGVSQVYGIVAVVLGAVIGIPEWWRFEKARWKSCPDCARKVRSRARVCEYCGYRFRSRDPDTG